MLNNSKNIFLQNRTSVPNWERLGYVGLGQVMCTWRYDWLCAFMENFRLLALKTSSKQENTLIGYKYILMILIKHPCIMDVRQYDAITSSTRLLSWACLLHLRVQGAGTARTGNWRDQVHQPHQGVFRSFLKINILVSGWNLFWTKDFKK